LNVLGFANFIVMLLTGPSSPCNHSTGWTGKSGLIFWIWIILLSLSYQVWSKRGSLTNSTWLEFKVMLYISKNLHKEIPVGLNLWTEGNSQSIVNWQIYSFFPLFFSVLSIWLFSFIIQANISSCEQYEQFLLQYPLLILFLMFIFYILYFISHLIELTLQALLPKTCFTGKQQLWVLQTVLMLGVFS